MLPDIVMIVYFFSLDIPIFQVQKFLPHLARSTLSRWFKELRERLITFSPMPQMSSSTECKCDIVEIDESLFGKKEKYQRGRRTKKQWVFGLAQRDSRLTSFHVVKDRTNATLHPIILEKVNAQVEIYHDDWAGYRHLESLGYMHGTVKHKETFISPEGVCTNLIEGLWGNIKMKIASMHGMRDTDLQLFLNEFSIRHYYAVRGTLWDHVWSHITATVI